MNNEEPQRQDSDFYFRVPDEAKSDFNEHQRRIARRVAVVVAASLLVIIPVFQAFDYLIYDDSELFGHRNAVLRMPMMALALTVLGFWWSRPHGGWPRPMTLLLAFGLMTMMVGILGNAHYMDDLLAAQIHAAEGLILVIAAVSVCATRGLRDIPIIYGLPLLALPFVLTHYGVPLAELARHLIYPLAMLVVACIVAELIYQSYAESFLASRRLRQHALTDPLTGLLNRRAMDAELKVAQSRVNRHGEGYALIMADLDRFKRVNDEYGHDVGDEVLLDLGRRLQRSIRAEDRLARWGGEEFLILIQDTNQQDAFLIAEKLRRAVKDTPFVTSAGELPITISLGLALYQKESPVEAVITRADQSLYRAKQNGRNQTQTG